MSAPDDALAARTGGTHVHVVRGTPDDVELAALVAGLVATSAGPGDDEGDALAVARDDAARAARARWTATGGPRGTTPQSPDPDAWRWSLHP
ncbi:acyl-CoA carboxylase subunit epsilon [Cellulomonas shaoxiangyii]|uniref:Acyl-CoA carboxylase subunit epsilon n=1 Tax=Cellulomonas shaoxiangyii TaxID=2566013 RepID=A0A4P7SKD3_9CELL|nr:acyl-CoA carboxylase subunit epsilon [Cellulomonas shaoxiangyii]QCB94311.1 acyl-CoA carboxylase subunit epsilon [Cellulomonas shaoxiangyii]TGY84534.1 acyl-CoA carboxylase subunit epsilon [Cellulomonas shaoxiangyii]